MEQIFDIYSNYYNLLYKDKDYALEVDFVIEQINKFAPSTKSLLELGSGTGIHGLLFQQKGFEIFGLERSDKMVDEAIKNGFPCKRADITNFKLDKKFDAIISLFHVISYITENSALINVMQNAHSHLNKEGIFLFDVWYSPAVYMQKALPRVKHMKNAELEITRIAEPEIKINDNIVDVHFTVFAKELSSGKITEIHETHPMRHFSYPEIGILALKTGFEIISYKEFLTDNNPSEKTWGVCFILKKR